jgi:hypothetical protein
MWRVPQEAWLAEQIDQQALTQPPTYELIRTRRLSWHLTADVNIERETQEI